MSVNPDFFEVPLRRYSREIKKRICVLQNESRPETLLVLSEMIKEKSIVSQENLRELCDSLRRGNVPKIAFPCFAACALGLRVIGDEDDEDITSAVTLLQCCLSKFLDKSWSPRSVDTNEELESMLDDAEAVFSIQQQISAEAAEWSKAEGGYPKRFLDDILGFKSKDSLFWFCTLFQELRPGRACSSTEERWNEILSAIDPLSVRREYICCDVKRWNYVGESVISNVVDCSSDVLAEILYPGSAETTVIRASIQEAISKKMLSGSIDAYMRESRLSPLPGKVAVMLNGKRVAIIPKIDV